MDSSCNIEITRGSYGSRIYNKPRQVGRDNLSVNRQFILRVAGKFWRLASRQEKYSYIHRPRLLTGNMS